MSQKMELYSYHLSHAYPRVNVNLHELALILSCLKFSKHSVPLPPSNFPLYLDTGVFILTVESGSEVIASHREGGRWEMSHHLLAHIDGLQGFMSLVIEQKKTLEWPISWCIGLRKRSRGFSSYENEKTGSSVFAIQIYRYVRVFKDCVQIKQVHPR
ncbi:hypothetical protein BDZ97DRAFT_2033765 [Flammula alnicola]|nr:hypothetical protein BDZ97DRAFT_2033765 [Flammula alnicola]